MRAIPIARAARRKHGLEPIVGRAGTLDAADALAARRIAAQLTAAREQAGEAAVSAGEVAALAALDAALHRLVEDEQQAGRADLAATFDVVGSALGSKAIADVDREWRGLFLGGARTAAAPRKDPGPDLLAEVLVLAALNENPGATAVRELVDDTPLRDRTAYEQLVDEAERQLGGRAPNGSAGAGRGSSRRAASGDRTRPRAARGAGAGALGPDAPLPARLREPMLLAPGSLAAQLRWIREHWPAIASDANLLRRIDLALDVLAEEARALELKGAGAHFGGPVVVERPDYQGLDSDAVAFSSDTDWMPSVVLMAKSTYVWLEQLARRFERPVQTLADVPDEELDRLAQLGVTGLWLIGLWQRSKASADIKRRRGDQDAVASAYSIEDYRIADGLGGEPAFEDLKRRASERGIRMAADMVPNHMGIDSRWVIEHPDRFISVPQPPYPAYRFTGPDLSDDDRVTIQIEDHYWDGTDAAVVFRRHDLQTGDERFIYHGNDGTSYPWNDTAQLDYLKADVREAVIQQVLDVARRAPILRFDAAMVLARRHIRRLWFPEPGAGGAIPSRAEHALSNAEFNRRMPNEFWREVVDRVAADAPGTLLLAEAFWLLEGYFVRTLGMHRVYNSAFMHMLRDEDNAGYRKVMRDTLEFDPAILARFVNFLTNPDERPAAEQFGTTDKAFSAATLLATLPGLPMLGHGQVEGFRERYGMEFRKARWDEPVDQSHADHFAWAIVPLLRRRAAFSGTSDFHLYDGTRDEGGVDENVYAFSNGRGEDRSLVLVHHHHGDTTVRIDWSIAAASPGGSGGSERTSVRLAEALALTQGDDEIIRFVDHRSGFEIRRTAGELRREGLRVSLGAYEARVLWLEPDRPAEPPTPGAEKPPRKAAATKGVVAPPPRRVGGSRSAARDRAARPSTRKPAVRRPRRRP